MSNGWAYPNPYMCENYNSPQSPYWGMKAFTPLALPSSHPFWTAQELPAPSSSVSLPIPGMVISHYPKNTVALMSGPSHDPSIVRFQAEKYCKFAYSTRYGFSIDFNTKNFENSCALGIDSPEIKSSNSDESDGKLVLEVCSTGSIALFTLFFSLKGA
jgi:hypothetical protein